MWFKFDTIQFQPGGVALAVLLSAAGAVPAHAAEMWKVNMARSKFSAGPNTLVLERYNGPASAPVVDTNGKPIQRVLIISNSKLYIAKEAAAADALAGKGFRTVADTAPKGPNVVQIGANAHSTDHCDFRCQGGLAPRTITLAFDASGVDPRDMMSDAIVLNGP